MQHDSDAPFLRRSPLGAFLKSEAAGGVLLMAAAATALVTANSPAAPAYFALLGSYVAGLSVAHWINDALMAVFFLLVGLEIKREFVEGQLSSWSRRSLPGIAALGGMIVPALIYLMLMRGDVTAARGWAIPTATDIAFALGVLALLGPRVPVSLKIFLTALAIIDDLGAVLIIALFYTSGLSLPMLGLAGACVLTLVTLNRLHVTRLWAYLAIGALLWFFVLKSGVHATLAGVALALTIPIGDGSDSDEPENSPLHTLEHVLQPYVAFLIVPIFGFANAGVSFTGMTMATALEPVPLGIALGLFLGKQIGVFGFAWLAVKSGLCAMPARASFIQLYGVALLCGIGFTMSLFIGALAFPGNPILGDETKLGVLLGSITSALAGACVLKIMAPGREKAPGAA